jgi:hypothetical protein
MDKIKQVVQVAKGPRAPVGDINLDEVDDNFDDYPSDLELDFTEHPYIRDESPNDEEDSLAVFEAED